MCEEHRLQFIVLPGTVVANVHKIHPDVFSNSRLIELLYVTLICEFNIIVK